MRWERLLDEHSRQAEQRHSDDRHPRRTGLLLQVCIALAVVASVALVVASGWYTLLRATRNDPSRCPTSATKTEVALGGWAEPDTCLYFDEYGSSIGGDRRLAGPVTRTYADVLGENNLEIALWGIGAVAVGAVAIVHWRSSARTN